MTLPGPPPPLTAFDLVDRKLPIMAVPHPSTLSPKEFRFWRGVAYRTGEAHHIRHLFPTLPRDPQDFWCTVYAAVRVMTHTLYSHDDIINLTKPEPPDEGYKEEDQLLSWWGIACRAQFWLDRHGIKMLPHVGQYIRGGLVHSVPKEMYDA